jgi:hypothetical protein
VQDCQEFFTNLSKVGGLKIEVCLCLGFMAVKTSGCQNIWLSGYLALNAWLTYT